MERADLLAANADLGPQGAALNDVAASDIRVLTVGNPANTNAPLDRGGIRPGHPRGPIHRTNAAGSADDRAVATARAAALSAPVDTIRDVTIWGNHSSQFPDIAQATVSGRPAFEALDAEVRRSGCRHRLARRRVHPLGGEARCGDHCGARFVIGGIGGERRDRARPRLGARNLGWTSAAVVSTASTRGCRKASWSFPVTSDGTSYSIVEGLELDERGRARLATTVARLVPGARCGRRPAAWSAIASTS